MKTAFIETSAINWFYNNDYTADRCNQIFVSNKLTPVVGMGDTIYELGRTFTTIVPNKGIELFNWLNRLNPIYSCQRASVARKEQSGLREFSIDDKMLHSEQDKTILTVKKEYTVVQYRRSFLPGGTYFFTQTLRNRKTSYLTDHINLLRIAMKKAQQKKYPFQSLQS